ncbi:MAG: sigma-70 family RNA polymerase sigma factor [Bdellovibrionales bacterium]|nr:sigma-70 family RNA polymerase sigma factor [Bdellovibrionales bacterium]
MNLESLAGLNDEKLIEMLKASETEAFIEIINRYQDKVHNLAMRITRNEQDTEEILQDVFVAVYTKIQKFEGKSAFSSWLYRITVNTSFMKLRRRKKHLAVGLDEVNPTAASSWGKDRSDISDLNYISTRHELKAELQKAISELPDEYRAIFILRDVDGLSNQEVGEVLDLSVPAVKSRLHRGRSLLRKRLQSFYNDYISEDKIAYGKKFRNQCSHELKAAA